MTLEDYTQPFYVPIGKGKLNLHTGVRGGYYLPALEPKEESMEGKQSEEPWTKKQWAIVNQLRGMVKFLYLKETERRANASKRKTNRYKEYT